MPVSRERIAAAFNPRVVAVVGSRKLDNYNWLHNMDKFQGKVYSVQIDPKDIEGIVEMGVPNYQRLVDVPETVDYVVVAVPARATPAVFRDAIAKGVKTVHFFTSGFEETGTAEGIQRGQLITQMARDAGTLVIGPNCMGVYNPANGMRFGQNQPVGETGVLTVLGQSGAHTSSLISTAQASGIGINKAVSFGNGIILDSSDLIEYFGDDPETQLIAMYIEGPKDSRRLFEALRRTAPRKPVVVWKGGLTEDGGRMAASHTGSLAGSEAVWDAVYKQTGAIRADSLEEALDVMKALVYLHPTTGYGVGIIGGTGGQSVAMSDDFSRAGLRVPRLSQPTLDTLGAFFQLVGASYFNPMDIGGINRANLETTINLLFEDPNINAVALLMGGLRGRRSKEELLAELELYQKARDKTGKPWMVMLWAPIPYQDGDWLQELDKTLQGLKVPTFGSPTRAARALKKAIDYQRFRQGLVDGR